MKKITILLFAVAAVGSGCKKFTNINNNVNQATSVTPNVLLSAALTASATNVSNGYEETAGLQQVNTFMGFWARSGGYIADNQTEDYNLSSAYGDQDFQNSYATLNDYNNVEAAGDASPSTLAFYIGVAKTMKALHFGTLVDIFNNVPYSQAFNITKYPTPKYDDAKTIYASLIGQCDSAVIYFTKAASYYASGPGTPVTIDDQYDIVFGRGAGVDPVARMQEWIEFVNTVKLRLLLHESSVLDATTIKNEINSAITSGGFLPAGTSASVNPGYSTASAAQQNPFYNEFFNTSASPNQNYDYYRANQYVMNYYNDAGDQVRPFLFFVPVGNNIVGTYEGDPATPPPGTTSPIGNGVIRTSASDQLLMSDFESLFLQAEAVQLGYMSGNASTLVQQALEQNFTYLGDNVADADAYYAGITASTNVSVAPTTIQGIISEKWASLNGIDWVETWDDYRRTGYPVSPYLGVSHAVNQVKHNGAIYIPFRFPYPESETDNNGGNVPTGVTEYTPVFWDTREK